MLHPHHAAHAVHDRSDDKVAKLKTHCRALGERLSTTRLRVFEALSRSHTALSAYELQTELAKNGHLLKPPSIYRALDFLTSQGFAHRIESESRFVPCCHPRQQHTSAFAVCTTCHKVREISGPLLPETLTDQLKTDGFLEEKSVIEILGRCRDCSTSQVTPHS